MGKMSIFILKSLLFKIIHSTFGNIHFNAIMKVFVINHNQYYQMFYHFHMLYSPLDTLNKERTLRSKIHDVSVRIAFLYAIEYELNYIVGDMNILLAQRPENEIG